MVSYSSGAYTAFSHEGNQHRALRRGAGTHRLLRVTEEFEADARAFLPLLLSGPSLRRGQLLMGLGHYRVPDLAFGLTVDAVTVDVVAVAD